MFAVVALRSTTVLATMESVSGDTAVDRGGDVAHIRGRKLTQQTGPYTYDFTVNAVNDKDDIGPVIFYVKLDGVMPSVDQFTVHLAPDREFCSNHFGGTCVAGVAGFIDGDELTQSNWHKASITAGTLLFSITTTVRVSEIEIKYHRPVHQPGWLIKENGVEVYRESTNGGSDDTPAPVTYTYDLAIFCDASTAPTNGGVGDCTDSLEIGSTCQPTCDTGYTLFGERSCVPGTIVDAADCLLPGQPAANPTTLKLVVDACLDAVPSGEKCCSTDPGCGDPATARCRGAGCVDMPDWDVSRVTDMTELFEDRTEFNQDISRWSTSSVTSFRETFRNASSFDQDLSRWGLSPGVDFTRTFVGADAFAQPVWTWPHASSTGMFSDAFTDLSDESLTGTKLLADDGVYYEYFGYSVSNDGDTMVIGAPYDDDKGVQSGSAYVFTRDTAGDLTSGWTHVAKLTADDGAASDFFGWSVSIDGDTVVIGAQHDDDKGVNSGSAYVFMRATAGDLTSGWTQVAKLTAGDGAANDEFGSSVSIDGDAVVIGAVQSQTSSGSAYVFTLACPDGYRGARCETAMPCVASTNSSKDGGDGDFHCVNGGTIGGTTGSCTCTSCDTAYGGASCHIGPCDMEQSCYDFNVRNGMTTPATCAWMAFEAPRCDAKCGACGDCDYELTTGDILGWGASEAGGSTGNVASARDCAKLCSENDNCLSYEYSRTSKICNRNTEADPTIKNNYRDYLFCSNKTAPAAVTWEMVSTGVNYPDGFLTNAGGSHESCKQLCAADANCGCYTGYNSWCQTYQTCTGQEGTTADPSAVTYRKVTAA